MKNYFKSIAYCFLVILAPHALGAAPVQAVTAAPDASAAKGTIRVYPERPVRILVALSAGGSLDTITRSLALKLSDQFGQSFVIDNRPGAGSHVALEILTTAAPDGHTLMMVGATTVVYPILFKSRFDLLRDVAPVAQITAQGYVLIVHPSLPVKSVPEFVQYLKANPDKVNYSSSGIGSPIHMSGELFKVATGTRMTHVPYKGMAQAYTDLVGGQVQASFPTVVSSLSYINAGRLRPLAVTTPKRVPAVPNLPTFAEAGVNGVVVVNWYAMIAPLKTPPAIINRLAAETNKAMRSPGMMKSLVAEGSEAVTGSPADLVAHIRAEHEQWSKVVTAAGISGK
jgi:tripartite-type tricarboxylate transporter receptor subunit TctC